MNVQERRLQDQAAKEDERRQKLLALQHQRDTGQYGSERRADATRRVVDVRCTRDASECGAVRRRAGSLWCSVCKVNGHTMNSKARALHIVAAAAAAAACLDLPHPSPPDGPRHTP